MTACGAVLIVPLRVACGIRMRILEAWARGVPVVATPAAATGLKAQDGRELLLARDAAEFAAAVARLGADRAAADSFVAAGRRALVERHRPDRIASELAAVYSEAIGRAGTVPAGAEDSAPPAPSAAK
jgi:glycosyltransferase involved in cell wall biosynthesis